MGALPSRNTVTWPQKHLPPEFGSDCTFQAAALPLDYRSRNAFAHHRSGLLLQGGRE